MDVTKVFNDFTWGNVVIEQDELKAMGEFSTKELKHKELHAVCSQLKINGVKNTLKDSMLKKIVSVYKLKERYGKLENDEELNITPPSKSPYRLLNILFLDRFSEGLVQLGNVADQFKLDRGKASNNQQIWEGIQESFIGHDELHDNLQFEDDEVLNDHHHINFQKIVLHDWKKLCATWKLLNAEYKAALSHYIMSGTHSLKLL